MHVRYCESVCVIYGEADSTCLRYLLTSDLRETGRASAAP